MAFCWPAGFGRVPDQDWTRQPLGKLALKYDTVENHGWYSNLDRTVEQLAGFLREGHVLLDYSGGTGILTGRLLHKLPDLDFGILVVDSSPKFLRLCLEKFRDEPRVGFRLIRYLRAEKRLELVPQVVEPALLDRGFDGVVSTNAIHLYYDLEETLRSWAGCLRRDGRAFIQSGNIKDPARAGRSEWIIDETVEHIHRAAIELVRGDQRYGAYRASLDDVDHMSKHDALRRKYFVPVRPLDHYLSALEASGLGLLDVSHATIEAGVQEWYEFISVYHEGVLGWVGGAEKVTGARAAEPVVADRLQLIREAMEVIFEARPTFPACWTYLICART